MRSIPARVPALILASDDARQPWSAQVRQLTIRALRGRPLISGVFPVPASPRNLLASVSGAAVLIADPHFPFLSEAVLAALLAAIGGGAEHAVPVLPATETVKALTADGFVASTIDRDSLGVLQSPAAVSGSRLARYDSWQQALAIGPGSLEVPGDPAAFRVQDDLTARRAARLLGVPVHEVVAQ